MTNGNDMATSNDALLDNLTQFKLESTKSMGQMSGDIRVLTTEVRQMNDQLTANIANGTPKQEFIEAKLAAAEVHKAIDHRFAKLEKWNEWATKLVLGAVIVSVLAVAGLKAGGSL